MRVLTLPMLALTLSACASSGTGHSAAHERTRLRSDALTAAEIQSSGRIRLLDAIEALRPRYLSTRRSQARPAPMVYLNNVRLGSPEQLSTLSTDGISEVRWLSAIDATTRYGTGHSGGAILVFAYGVQPSRTW
jgi:hypothetical protein